MKQKASFYEQVYEMTRMIPPGRVTTYGIIAEYLMLGAPRMVGWALHQGFTGEDVPAHRVVNRNGELTGRLHFPTPTMMQELLESEGVQVVDNRVQDFERLVWRPEESG